MNGLSAFFDRRFVVGATALIALVVIALLGWMTYFSVPQGPAPTTFFECSNRYPVREAFPRECHVPWGKTFVEYVGNQPAVADEIGNLSLPPAPVISASPLTFTGEAVSDWYGSDGSFNVELVVGTGEVIATAAAQQDKSRALPGSTRLPFAVTLTFTAPQQNTQGALVFHKSGSTDALVFPVVF